jgi:ribosomal protein S18 acetylase RimI-like enzyme
MEPAADPDDADAAGEAIAESIAGMIAVRNGNHVSLLFVEPSLHGRGIGRRLFESVLAQMRQRLPGLERVTVNSSDYAVPFYRALGFETIGRAYYKRGMRITPMRKDLV